MKPLTILTSLLILVLSYSCDPYKAVKSMPESLIGDWMSTDSLHWKLTIQEHFAVYENEIQPIKSISTNSRSFRIHLGESKELIEVTLVGDSLELNGAWLTRNFKISSRIPKEIKAIFDKGKTLIQGYIKNCDSTDYLKPLTLHVPDHILGTEHEYNFEIDSAGTFSTLIDLNNTQNVWLRLSPDGDYRKVLRRLLLSPNDTITLSIDDRHHPGTVHFMGKSASACYDIFYMDAPYYASLPDYRAYNKALGGEPEAYLRFRKKYRTQELKFLEEYCASKNCSELFKEWFVANSEVAYYGNLMKFSWQSLKYGLGSTQRLTPLMKKKYESQFLDSIDPDSKKYLLSSSYFSLLNGLSHRVITSQSSHEVFSDQIRYLIQKKEMLSDTEYDFLTAIATAGLTPDHFTPAQKEKWWAIEDKFADELIIFKYKNRFQWLIEEIQRMDNPNTRDLLWANYFYGYVVGNELYEVADFAYNLVADKIQNEKYLEHVNTIYHEMKQQEAGIKNLNLEPKKVDGSGEALLEEIIRDNPDKIIVLDFWGTWCQPCLKDFQETRAITTELNQEISFVYLCLNSTERSWKNILSKHNPEGQHYLLSTRQTEELLSKFNITSFPTYLLIDKNRKLHRNIPKPSEKSFKLYLEKMG